jgi:hypothetical protein
MFFISLVTSYYCTKFQFITITIIVWQPWSLVRLFSLGLVTADKISFLPLFVSLVLTKFHYNKSPYVSLSIHIAESSVLQRVTTC